MAHQSAYQSRRVGAIRLDEVALDGQPSATRGVAMSAGDVPIADEETFYVELICRFWRVSEYLNFHRAALDVRAARDVLQVREPATVLNNLQLLALTLKSHWKPVAAELGENASEIRSRVQETLLYFLRRFNLMNDMLASAYDSLPDA